MKIDMVNQYVLFSPSLKSKEIKQRIRSIKPEDDIDSILVPYSCVDMVAGMNTGIKVGTIIGMLNPNYIGVVPDKKLTMFFGWYQQGDSKRIVEIVENPKVEEIDIAFPIMWYFKGKLLRITKYLSNIKKKAGNKPVSVIAELVTAFSTDKSLWEVCKIINDSGCDMITSHSGIIEVQTSKLLIQLAKLKDITKVPVKVLSSPPNRPVFERTGVTKFAWGEVYGQNTR